jgi:hypothetical protein
VTTTTKRILGRRIAFLRRALSLFLEKRDSIKKLKERKTYMGKLW